LTSSVCSILQALESRPAELDFNWSWQHSVGIGKSALVGVDLNCLYDSAGIGKSTLLGLISGSLEPTKGTITRNAKVRMAVFSQHHVDGLDLALTPLAYMLASFPNTKDQEHRWAS